MNSTHDLGWTHTSMGGKFYPTSVMPDDIHISDIANALALTCRYGGHGDINKFYSVAEHSVLLAEYALEDAGSFAAMYALLHDASEAYLGDLVPAVKNCLGEVYKNLEKHVMEAVMHKYSKHRDFHDYVKHLDMRIVPTEKKELMRHPQPWPSDAIDPLPVRIRCWAPQTAKACFLNLWEDLRHMNGLPEEHWET